MKSNRSLSDIAAQVLSADARTMPKVAPEARLQAIEEIARAMQVQKRRGRFMRWAGLGSVAAAASIALAIGLGRTTPKGPSTASEAALVPAAAASFVRGSPVVVRQGALEPLSDGTPLLAGDRLLVEPGSRTTVALANGTYLMVEDHAELLLKSAGPEMTFELASGAVRADVAKLAPNERFIIRTADAEIEVHGTSFEVSRAEADAACGNGTTTRVKVSEGIVAVRSRGAESFVRANEVWPSGCEPAEKAQTAPSRSAAGPTTPGASPVALPARVEAGGHPSRDDVAGSAPHQGKRTGEAAASDLAAQNDLFEKAVARKRASDVPGAIAGFEQVLAQYPTGHHAQSARAERMKLLRGVDKERARAAAHEYLDRHPNGFARRDAELILSGE